MGLGVEDPESSQPVEQASESTTPNGEGQQGQRQRTPIHPFINEFRAYREAQDRYEKSKTFREKLTLAVLILALFVYGGQLFTYRGQLDVMRRSIVNEQRAWVTLSMEPRALTIVRTTRTANMTLKVSNIGKTPAKRILLHFDVQVIVNGQSPMFKLSSSALTADFGSLFPGESNQLPRPFAFDSQTFKQFLSGKVYLIMFGRTDYEDATGIPHWVKTCSWYGMGTETFTSRDCIAYNDVDNN